MFKIDQKVTTFVVGLKNQVSRISTVHTVRDGFMTEFIGFLQQYGIVALAIGVVMGQAVNNLVGSFVSDILTPFISLILKAGFRDFSLKDTEVGGIRYGSFIDSSIKFILIAVIIYLVVRYLVVYLMNDDEKQKFIIRKQTEENTSVINRSQHGSGLKTRNKKKRSQS